MDLPSILLTTVKRKRPLYFQRLYRNDEPTELPQGYQRHRSFHRTTRHWKNHTLCVVLLPDSIQASTTCSTCVFPPSTLLTSINSYMLSLVSLKKAEKPVYSKLSRNSSHTSTKKSVSRFFLPLMRLST